jgi:predicted NBD/HSP70 family sugar kinase/mannose-6-phosphate isomerase class I
MKKMNEGMSHFILGVDIGGSHVSAGLVDPGTGDILHASLARRDIRADGDADTILQQWAEVLRAALAGGEEYFAKAGQWGGQAEGRPVGQVEGEPERRVKGQPLGQVGRQPAGKVGGEPVGRAYGLQGVAIAMPGPFDYQNGISLMKGVNKYDALYGMDVRAALRERVGLATEVPIWFENDAVCFGLGESLSGSHRSRRRMIAVTVGTGFGSAFIESGRVLRGGTGVARNGELYNTPYLDGICEDYISSKWIMTAYNREVGATNAGPKAAEGGRGGADSVYTIAQRAMRDREEAALDVFATFGRHLAACLGPWVTAFGAECVVIGGGVAQSSELFLPVLTATLHRQKVFVPIRISPSMEVAAIRGAVAFASGKVADAGSGKARRKTLQPLMPMRVEGRDASSQMEGGMGAGPGEAGATGAGRGEVKASEPEMAGTGTRGVKATGPEMIGAEAGKAGGYDMYPSFNIGGHKIFTGYDSLGQWMAARREVMIEGFPGVDWELVRDGLSGYFDRNNIRVCWYDTRYFEKPADVIGALVKPFIGQPGEVWGKRADLSLSDLFDVTAIQQLDRSTGANLHVIIGTGAAFAGWGSLVYIDIPKNEIQYRMRAGQRVSLTVAGPRDPAGGAGGGKPVETDDGEKTLSNAEIYKRLYFVDWVLNKRHRQSIYPSIDVVADGQWGGDISWAFASSVYEGLESMSGSLIRARPWFEAGAWGGQWLKQHIPRINKNSVNYAWSFELIVPENGVVLESNGNRLEVAFDWLMENHAAAILGKDAGTYGTEFPIRFDYLDTMDGGNLSIQCHPSRAYIRETFGETITQDETYYILDCAPDATVYLGFQEDIDRGEFRHALEESAEQNTPIRITNYVQVHDARKHDLFLIPSQTIHSAGKNNLVLEISATPYIFTFKMYDWLRLDLDGSPRLLNIEHAFRNLDFTRKGKKVREEFVSKPVVLQERDGYRLVHLPTHPEHFYDVHRVEFRDTVRLHTNNQCQVMMLVQGISIQVRIEGRPAVRLYYAETFVIPAAAGAFELINDDRGEGGGEENKNGGGEANKERTGEVKVIKVFIK